MDREGYYSIPIARYYYFTSRGRRDNVIHTYQGSRSDYEGVYTTSAVNSDGEVHKIAMKVVKPTDSTSPRYEKLREMIAVSQRLSKASHPNILQPYFVKDTENIIILSELCSGGSLEEKDNTAAVLQDETLQKAVVVAVARALAISHGLNIAHRDVKASNVFLRKSPDELKTLSFEQVVNNIVLADWDEAKIFDKDQDKFIATGGTFPGPEYFRITARGAKPQGLMKDLPKSDMWALGHLLHCVWTGTPLIMTTKKYDLFTTMFRMVSGKRLTRFISNVLDICRIKQMSEQKRTWLDAIGTGSKRACYC